MDENERRFHLDVEIAREDVVEWLEAVPPDRLAGRPDPTDPSDRTDQPTRPGLAHLALFGSGAL